MKVKFTKLAALLLAGAALLASGCTDYEVDIQEANKRIDQLDQNLKTNVAELNSQVDALKSMISALRADHDADIAAVRNEMATLKTTLENDYNTKIQDAVNTLNAAIDKKLDKTTFEAAKQQIEEALASANAKIQALEQQDEAFKAQIADLTAQVNARLTALENLLAGDWDGKTVKETIDALNQKVIDLEATLQGEINMLDERLTAAEAAITKINEETIPALEARVKDLEEVVIPALQQDIQDLKDGKVDKVDFEAYKTATAATISLMQEAIDNLAETKVDKTVFEAKVAEIMAKFNDYVLTTTFEAFVEIAATKAELLAVENALKGRLDVLEALTAGFPE